tara:strand:- start:259 stop:618 length:360 start_codon:yes stop_codon:yes gene_type:complete
MKTLQDRLVHFGQRLYEAAIPCAVLMVQGNVLSLTPKHILIAMKTGILTGTFAVLLSFIPFLKKYYNNEIVLSFVIFACTTCADLLTHPSHFGGPTIEALATGLGAVMIYLGFTRYTNR